MIDLSALPAPNVIEPLDAATILSKNMAKFQSLMPGATLLDSDPAVKVLQAGAYMELLLRARINDAARRRLLAFMSGGDIDQRAADDGLTRMAGESDDRFILRLQLAIAARAGNGTTEKYQLIAMSASSAVSSAIAKRITLGHVGVYLFLMPGADVAAALSAVQAALTDPGKATGGVDITVYVAVPRAIDIGATIYRSVGAPANLVASIEASIAPAFAALLQLGGGIAASWINALLHTTGVRRLENVIPQTDVILADNQYPVPGNINLVDGGVSAW
jgi:phage-related baseplate assembly protein